MARGSHDEAGSSLPRAGLHAEHESKLALRGDAELGPTSRSSSLRSDQADTVQLGAALTAAESRSEEALTHPMKTRHRKRRHLPDDGEQQGVALDSCCGWDGETLVLNVLGEPRAERDAIGEAKGKQLRISVTATPVAGRATDHMVRFLAGEFGVPVVDIEVIFGRFNVNKQLRIRAPRRLPAVVAAHLATEMPELDL